MSSNAYQMFSRSLLDSCRDSTIKIDELKVIHVREVDTGPPRRKCTIEIVEGYQDLLPPKSHLERVDYYYHYTSSELESFCDHLRFNSWVTTTLYLEAMTAKEELGMKRLPTMVFLVRDEEQVFIFNRDRLHWQSTEPIPTQHLGPAMKLLVPSEGPSEIRIP